MYYNEIKTMCYLVIALLASRVFSLTPEAGTATIITVTISIAFSLVAFNFEQDQYKQGKQPLAYFIINLFCIASLLVGQAYLALS